MDTIPPAPGQPCAGYDEATLLAARGDSFLLVDEGLAVTAQWVARAASGLRLVLPPPGTTNEDAAAYYRHSGLPGHRAMMRALLADAQGYVDRHPERPATALIIGLDPGGAVDQDAAVAWLAHPEGWLRVGLAPAHLRLAGPGDRLLPVRRHRTTHVLVVRLGLVCAVIRGRALVGDAAGQPDRLTPG